MKGPILETIAVNTEDANVNVCITTDKIPR